MKKMEFEIFETSILVFVVGTLLGGIYSIVFGKGSFFYLEVIMDAIFVTLFYLWCIWMNTRRHQLLTCLGSLLVTLYILLTVCHMEENVDLFGELDWKATILRVIAYMVLFWISVKQADELMEEDSEKVNVIINVKGTIRPEDIDVDIR